MNLLKVVWLKKTSKMLEAQLFNGNLYFFRDCFQFLFWKRRASSHFGFVMICRSRRGSSFEGERAEVAA